MLFLLLSIARTPMCLYIGFFYILTEQDMQGVMLLVELIYSFVIDFIRSSLYVRLGCLKTININEISRGATTIIVANININIFHSIA